MCLVGSQSREYQIEIHFTALVKYFQCRSPFSPQGCSCCTEWSHNSELSGATSVATSPTFSFSLFDCFSCGVKAQKTQEPEPLCLTVHFIREKYATVPLVGSFWFFPSCRQAHTRSQQDLRCLLQTGFTVKAK